MLMLLVYVFPSFEYCRHRRRLHRHRTRLSLDLNQYFPMIKNGNPTQMIDESYNWIVVVDLHLNENIHSTYWLIRIGKFFYFECFSVVLLCCNVRKWCFVMDNAVAFKTIDRKKGGLVARGNKSLATCNQETIRHGNHGRPCLKLFTRHHRIFRLRSNGYRVWDVQKNNED